MPHFYRYTGGDEEYVQPHPNVKEFPIEGKKMATAHVRLLGLGADLSIPGCDDNTNKTNASNLFKELDKVIVDLKEENRKLREEVNSKNKKSEDLFLKIGQRLKICEENTKNENDAVKINELEELRIKVDLLEKQQNNDQENTKANIDKIMTEMCNINMSQTCKMEPITVAEKDLNIDESTAMSVMFDATRKEDYKGQDDYLTFNKATINLGEAMDIATGKFTAPVSGIYFFCLQVYGAPRDAVVMSIRANEFQDIASISGVGKGSQTALVHLDCQDTCGVWVDAKTKLSDSSANHFTHFIGMLIKPKQTM